MRSGLWQNIVPGKNFGATGKEGAGPSGRQVLPQPRVLASLDSDNSKQCTPKRNTRPNEGNGHADYDLLVTVTGDRTVKEKFDTYHLGNVGSVLTALSDHVHHTSQHPQHSVT